MELKTIIFFGKSGSGKGTQAELVVKDLQNKDPEKKVLHIETGRLFRDFAQKENHTAVLLGESLGRGELTPDFLPIWAWTEFLIEKYTGKEHLVFDGAPRRLNDGMAVDGALKFFKRPKAFVVEIKVSDQWARERLLGRGRADDNEKDIAERLSWFERDVRPTIEFFKSQPEQYSFFEINGEQTVESVHEEILEKLKFKV